MSEIFVKVLLSLSLSGTLLMLLVLLLKQLWQNKFSRSWQYYIWLIVALRFLLPITPANTVMSYLFERFDTATITENTIQEPSFTAAEPSPVNMPVVQSDSTASPVSPSAEFSAYTVILLVWLAAALMLITRKVTIYQCFMQYIQASNREMDDIDTLNILADCEERLHVHRMIRLYQNPLIGSPMMIGFVRPAIVLPMEPLNPQELSYIFTHELLHYKRWDLFYKWFIQFVICVHWFNPFVYLLGKEINKACELSCDEAVISPLDKNAKRAYGDTLVSALKKEHSYQNSLASVTLTEGAEQIKERLGAIMKFSKKGKVITVVTIALTIVLCICAIGIGAYTASASSPDSEFGIVSKKVKVPDVVLNAAIDWIEWDYTYANSLAEQDDDFYPRYINWRIDSLEHVYTYEDWNDMTLQVYLLNYTFLAEDPENVTLAGGMSIDEEGWVVPGYPNSQYFLFQQEGKNLTYFTHMVENDCSPGDNIFTNDLQLRLQQILDENSDSKMISDEELTTDDTTKDSGKIEDTQALEDAMNTFAWAYFNGDADLLKQYLAVSYAGDIDLYDDLNHADEMESGGIKGLSDYLVSGPTDECELFWEFRNPGEDSLTWLTVNWVREEDGWKVSFYGLEK